MSQILKRAKNKLKEVESTREINQYNKALTYESATEIIFNGGVVMVWSKVLNETVYWVYGEVEAKKVITEMPNAVVYTWPELCAASKIHDFEMLKVFHQTKKIFAAKWF